MKLPLAVPTAFLAACVPLSVHALTAEDAGKTDFLVATSGHGTTRFARLSTDGDALIGSDAGAVASGRTSCYVSKRSLDDGRLLWRRDVCTRHSDEQSHAVAVEGDSVFTMDNVGIVRGWNARHGQLLWELESRATTLPSLWTFRSLSGELFLAAASRDTLAVVSARGTLVGNVSASDALRHANQGLGGSVNAQWIHVIPQVTSSGAVRSVVAAVKPDGTLAKKPVLLELHVGADTVSFGNSRVLGHAKPNIVAASVRSSDTVGAGSNSRDWCLLARAHGTDRATMLCLDTVDTSTDIPLGVWNRLTQDVYPVDANKAAHLEAATYCNDADILIGVDAGKPVVFKTSQTDTPVHIGGDTFLNQDSPDAMAGITLLSCSHSHLSFLLATESGTTTAVRMDVGDDNNIKSSVLWTAQDGMATISSAIMLDGTHVGSDDLAGDQHELIDKLSFSSRILSQLSGATSAVADQLGKLEKKDHSFGFVKIAVLLSQSAHRLWGMDTAGSNRGNVKWTLNLPRNSEWHTMVHGTKNAKSAVHGINGGTHSREILVLSAGADQVSWICVDGASGDVHAQGTVAIVSPIQQVMPIYGAGESCRQGALVLHQDKTVSAIPDDQQLKNHFMHDIEAIPNGFFTHVINRDASTIESVQVRATGGAFSAMALGQTKFAGERIVAVSYPIRDEIVQRISTVLGDNSLLLKYINPHMVAVITVTRTNATEQGELASSVSRQGPSGKRKPVGASNEGAGASATANTPNLFVNLIDTVTGRIIHRTSHVNADPSSKVCVTISENWVIYTFVNNNSKRTELGVLTLHEGMINSKSLTAFSTPEQATSFSSFDGQESEPVVLSKLYTFPKAVTALGSTATRDGISARQILLATNDGKITSIPRHMLETRRPTGELKPEEKAEGLVQYTELVPMVPLMALTYNNTAEGVNKIISTHTNLESQSLVLAFGGPDIFFTRTSPTKGFDLLPESFSHVLVSIVTVALLIVLVVVRNMTAKKAIKQGWV